MTPDDEETTEGPVTEVREFNGRRIFSAQRLSSGNWLLIETNGLSRRTVNNEDFTRGYERVNRNGTN